MRNTAMTLGWRLSAAKECMDGMPLLIKDVFFLSS